METKYKSKLPCSIFENINVAETKDFGEDKDDYIWSDKGSTFRPNCVLTGCLLYHMVVFAYIIKTMVNQQKCLS